MNEPNEVSAEAIETGSLGIGGMRQWKEVTVQFLVMTYGLVLGYALVHLAVDVG